MRIAFLTATLLVSSIASAATPIDGWYSSLYGGYSYIPNNVRKSYLGTQFNRATFNNGYNVGGRLGFQGGPMRYEGEFTYLNAQAGSFSSNRFIQFFRPNRLSGHSSAALGMANIYYDFPDMVPCIAPFVGGGIGYAWVNTRLTTRNFFGFNNFSASDNLFAYQGTAGFTYNFAENYALNIAYRYIGTTNAGELGKKFQAHLASVGVVYRFNEYYYK